MKTPKETPWVENILAHNWKMGVSTTVGSGVVIRRFESFARFNTIKSVQAGKTIHHNYLNKIK